MTPLPISEWVKTPQRERLAVWLPKPSGKRDREVWVMARSVYIDESGSGNKDKGLLLLAGYVSTTERWMRFADEWAAVLAHYKLEEIHMKDLWDGEGCFDETRICWAERKKIITRCEDIIQRRAEVGICVVIQNEDYNDIVRGKLCDAEGVRMERTDNPYHMLFRGLVSGLGKLDVLKQEQESIALFFDEQDQYSAAAQEDFGFFKKLMQSEGDNRFTGPRFENSKAFLPLQAADMLAWSHHRRITKRRARFENEWPARPAPDGFLQWVLLDRKWLSEFVEYAAYAREKILEKKALLEKRASP